jgi:hypothetical protein
MKIGDELELDDLRCARRASEARRAVVQSYVTATVSATVFVLILALAPKTGLFVFGALAALSLLAGSVALLPSRLACRAQANDAALISRFRLNVYRRDVTDETVRDWTPYSPYDERT